MLLALAALAVFAAPASAATPTQIHEDAADGSLDGTYTMAELRAADREATAVQREYYGWEDVYRAAVRALGNPDAKAAPVVVPIDANRNGKIDPAEKAIAVKKTKAKRKAAGVDPDPDTATEGDDDEGDVSEPAADKGDDAKDDGGSPLIWLIAGVPLLIVAIGAWRMRRSKRAPEDDEQP